MLVTVELSHRTRSAITQLADKRKKLDEVLKRSITAVGNHLESAAKKAITGDALNVRSGSLRRGVTHKVKFDGDGITLTVGVLEGPPTRYASIHEYGGDIDPQKSKWLTIPVGPALTPAGVSRYPSASDVPLKLSFVPTGRYGVSLLVARAGQTYFKGSSPRRGKGIKQRKAVKLGKDQVWYVLKKGVRLKATHWLSDAMKAEQGKVDGILNAALRRHLQ